MAPRTKMASGSPHGGQQPSANVDDRSSDEEEYDDWEEYDEEDRYEYPLHQRQFREERDDFNRDWIDDERDWIDDSRPARDVPTEYGSDDEEGDAPVRIFFSFDLIDSPRDVARTQPAVVMAPLVAEEAKEGDETCCVCLSNVPDCKFVDCKHRETGFICRICADRLVKSSTGRSCPFCRKAVTDYKVIVPVKPNHTWPDSIWSDRTWPDRTWPDRTWPDSIWSD